METANEYRVKVTVRNNLILEAIEALGYTSVKAFADTNRISYTVLASMVALKTAPIGTNGEFTKVAKELMEILGAAPSDLWSDEQLTMELKKNSSERAVGMKEFSLYFNRMTTGQLEYTTPEEEMERQEVVRVVNEQIDGLSPKEAKILRMRFGIGCAEMTLDEIAQRVDLTRERIRQIEVKALRKLKNPNRSDALRDALDGGTKEMKIADLLRQQEMDRQRVAKMQVLEGKLNAGQVEPENVGLAQAVLEGGVSRPIKRSFVRAIMAVQATDDSWIAHLKRTNPELYEALKERIKENVERFG